MAWSLFQHRGSGKTPDVKKGNKHSVDMCNGPIGFQIIAYFIPMMMTCLLQFTFNAADIIVVGRYANHQAMAAVGSTGAFSHILITFYLGLSVGTNVIAARAYGAKDNTTLNKTTHTSILTAIICGCFGCLLTFFISRPILKLMQTPDDVITLATRYMQLYGLGLPFMMIYNFGSSILRAAGDTKRPMYFLAMGGIINVILNMILVIVFHLDVEGVAIATAVSHVIAAFLTIRALKHANDASRLNLKKLKIDKSILIEMLKIGIPSGFQSSFFSLSNMVIQSSINGFGSLCMAGSAAASNLESIAYAMSYSYYQTSQSFVGQNYGGRKLKRIKQSIFHCMVGVVIISTITGGIMLYFGRNLVSIYNEDPEVIDWAMTRLKSILCYYGLCGIMDVEGGALRSMGYSTVSAISCLVGACLLRVVWVMTIFQSFHTIQCLFLCYPASWIFTSIVSGMILYYAYQQTKKKFKLELQNSSK